LCRCVPSDAYKFIFPVVAFIDPKLVFLKGRGALFWVKGHVTETAPIPLVLDALAGVVLTGKAIVAASLLVWVKIGPTVLEEEDTHHGQEKK
jgi:hypothetical protein